MDIKNSETIVIQLGSLHLRIGFANQLIPHILPNVIAYRQSPCRPCTYIPPCDAETLFKAYSIVQDYLTSEGYLRNKIPKIIAPKRKLPKTRKEQCESSDENEVEIELNAIPSPTDSSSNQSYFVGEEAYNLPPSTGYTLHWPILRGHFNISESQTFWVVVNDIEKILEYTIIKVLRVPREMFPQFSVVLLLPDAFYKDQVKALLDILLRQLGFRAAFLQQESVAAVFGAGVGSACVVDIGARHINVVCVEEGVILSRTHLRQLYSGRDIDILLQRVLIHPNGGSLDDLRTVEALKQRACRLVQQDQIVNYTCRGRGEPLKVHSTNPILVVGAHSLFHINLLEISSGVPELAQVLHPALSVDTDDYLSDLLESAVETSQKPTIAKGLSLHQMIIRSISALENSETRKKMANCILLAGGGGMFPDLVDLLEERLINCFPEDAEVLSVDVKASVTHSDSSGSKECIPPNHLMWVGGTVIPLLDSAKELWISKHRWLGQWIPTEAKEELMANLVSFENPCQIAERCRKWRRDRPLEGGVRHLKEKATFPW